MNISILLTTAYLAPIQYYSKLVQFDKVIIEAHENFIKQSYRNRCNIYGANGKLPLSIPIKKDKPKTKIKDIRIDYDTNWRKLHWKSIESAYRSSPFFEFYQDDIRPFYDVKYTYLLDFNHDIQKIICEQLEIEPTVSFSEEYHTELDQSICDFRDKIHPKKKFEDSQFNPTKYTQVFQDKHGFLPNLSIIDLLFNEGPNAINVLIDL